jgi:hypothetical protein
MTPAVPITNPAFRYIPAAATDVRETWKKFGWTPPSQDKRHANQPH